MTHVITTCTVGEVYLLITYIRAPEDYYFQREHDIVAMIHLHARQEGPYTKKFHYRDFAPITGGGFNILLAVYDRNPLSLEVIANSDLNYPRADCINTYQRVPPLEKLKKMKKIKFAFQTTSTSCHVYALRLLMVDTGM